MFHFTFYSDIEVERTHLKINSDAKKERTESNSEQSVEVLCGQRPCMRARAIQRQQQQQKKTSKFARRKNLIRGANSQQPSNMHY